MAFNCSCLALDLHRVFSFYWQLHDRDYIPSIWSKRVSALYGRHNPLQLQLNGRQADAYVSVRKPRLLLYQGGGIACFLSGETFFNQQLFRSPLEAPKSRRGVVWGGVVVAATFEFSSPTTGSVINHINIMARCTRNLKILPPRPNLTVINLAPLRATRHLSVPIRFIHHHADANGVEPSEAAGSCGLLREDGSPRILSHLQLVTVSLKPNHPAKISAGTRKKKKKSSSSVTVVSAGCLTGALFLQASPELFCAKDRTRDVDAISQVIQTAKTFVFISVTDYLPLVSRRFRGTTVTRCHRSQTLIFP